MEVSFRTRKLQKCFEQSVEAKKRWGTDVARKYIKAIIFIQITREFSHLYKARTWRLHPLEGKRKGRYAMDLHDRWRLEIEREGDTAIRILEVTNHYDD